MPFLVRLLVLRYACGQLYNRMFVNTGAFVSGIIVPREGGLTIALTEKLEDMVTIIFLPLVRSLQCFFRQSC